LRTDEAGDIKSSQCVRYLKDGILTKIDKHAQFLLIALLVDGFVQEDALRLLQALYTHTSRHQAQYLRHRHRHSPLTATQLPHTTQ